MTEKQSETENRKSKGASKREKMIENRYRLREREKRENS